MIKPCVHVPDMCLYVWPFCLYLDYPLLINHIGLKYFLDKLLIALYIHIKFDNILRRGAQQLEKETNV